MIKKLSKMKIIVICIIIIIIILFGLYNIFWYQVVYPKYDKYSESMVKSFSSTNIFSNNTYDCPKDGYAYLVRYPEYLRYTGSLFIGTIDNKVGLLICPEIFGKDNEYGITIQDEQNNYQVMVNRNMIPIYRKDAVILGKYKKVINELLIKAHEEWQSSRPSL